MYAILYNTKKLLFYYLLESGIGNITLSIVINFKNLIKYFVNKKDLNSLVCMIYNFQFTNVYTWK